MANFLENADKFQVQTLVTSSEDVRILDPFEDFIEVYQDDSCFFDLVTVYLQGLRNFFAQSRKFQELYKKNQGVEKGNVAANYFIEIGGSQILEDL